MVAKFMATYSYRLPEVLEMPFSHFCELYQLIDDVAADGQLERCKPMRDLMKLRDGHYQLMLPATGGKAHEREMAEGMREMGKLRKSRLKEKE